MMDTKKIGRNDPCPCGSGEKYKRCCERKLHTAGSSGILALVVLVGVVIVAIVMGIGWFSQDSAPANAGRVWSPEHGHYHNSSTPGSAPASSGRVWSPEHGHYH